MKIKNLHIKGLYGTFNYNIELLEECNPFILTGLNGYGKTTLLTIINKLADKDFFYFYSLPCDSIIVSFENSISIEISYSKSKANEAYIEYESDSNLTPNPTVTFRLLLESKIINSFKLDEETIKNAFLRVNSYNLFGYHNETETPNYGSVSFYDRIRKNSEFKKYLRDNEWDAFEMMLDSFKVTFIEAQRVLITKIIKNDVPFEADEHPQSVPQISDISVKIAKLLRHNKDRFLMRSQSADRNFIDKLLSENTVLAKDEYDSLREEVEIKAEELYSFGLIERFLIREYEEEHKQVLSTYLNSIIDRLSVFDIVIPKLRLFKNKISELNFVNKSVSYDPRNGLSVRTNDGKLLDLDRLSSGEQNEIIMLYYMIFEVKDGSILLIDEPEISLHVAWQNDFVDSLKEIADEKSLQIIIATHSPQIIGNRWEQCYDLCENLLS